MKTKTTVLTTLTLALTACQALPTTSQPAKTSPNLQATQATADTTAPYLTKLDNGLTVIIKQDTRAPIVMTQIWYNVGSADEPLGKGGISHYLEHLMFKDSVGVSGNDYQRLMSHFGSQNNAFTTDEHTVYYESLPANQFPLALQIEANRMKNLLLKTDEVATERQIIKEERRLRTEDNPLAKAYEEFLQQAMPNSPKGRPIIGSMADLDNITLDDLQQWYRTWYAPNNAVLVLVGDISPEAAMPWVKKYFAPLPALPLPQRVNLDETSHRGYKELQSTQNVEVPSLLLGFNVPALGSKMGNEAYALSLLSDIADGGLSARFEQNLVRKSQKLNSVSVSYDMLAKGDTVFSIFATPRANVSLQEAQEAILSELWQIYQNPIKEEELARSRASLLSSLVFANDSIDNQANTLGLLASMGLPLDTLQTLPNKLDTISQDDIKNVGKKYLNKDNLTSVHIIPKQP
ncbi:M16 family metallopeptidase [Moraxella cuniculi]|uniref:Protease 3 n=1 Tax=Moraxella cuniculi TaxID=34061 RepID=A0A448GXI5_9GAMM|nr:pitrilysin family protein [Moraxella cuniculi]VEG13497.1 Protease 3 precursor [Moraxella cuniculi]